MLHFWRSFLYNRPRLVALTTCSLTAPLILQFLRYLVFFVHFQRHLVAFVWFLKLCVMKFDHRIGIITTPLYRNRWHGFST